MDLKRFFEIQLEEAIQAADLEYAQKWFVLLHDWHRKNGTCAEALTPAMLSDSAARFPHLLH